MRLWKKELFKELIKYFVFYFLAIYVLYMIMDLSYQTGRFLSYSKSDFFGVSTHYYHHLLIHMDLFVPLSFLFSVLKVLSTMNLHHELTALRMGGVSFFSLFTPVLSLGLLFSLGNLANFQFLFPGAQNKIDEFKICHLKKPKSSQPLTYQVALIGDNSKMVFQTKEKTTYSDIFWIKSSKEFWHIKTLQIKKIPTALFVDKFQRNDKGFYKTESKDKIAMPKLRIKKILKEISCNNLSISDLAYQGYCSATPHEEKAASLTHLYFKTIIAFLPLLLAIAVFPFCVEYGKISRFFFLTVCFLFGIIAAYAYLDTTILLGENQVLWPFLLQGVPFLGALAFFLHRFVKKASAM